MRKDTHADVDLNRQLRGIMDSMNAPGLQTYGAEYMPFASGRLYDMHGAAYTHV